MCFALVTLLTSSICQAQATDPVAATELFKKGRDAAVQNDFETACPLFEESNRLDAKVGTLLNLADCEERIGKLAEALQHWHQAVQLGTATGDVRVREARSRSATLDGRVPRLTVKLAEGVPASAKVERDGVPLGRAALGVAMPLNPGTHVVEVRAPGHEPKRFRFTVAEAESKDLHVTVGPRLPEPTADAPPPSLDQQLERPDSDRSLAYALGGIGLAGVIVGSVTGAMLWNKNRTIDAQCNDRNQCSSEGLGAVEDAKGLLPVSNVAWIVGVVGLGASTYLFLTSGPSEAGPPGPAQSVVGDGVGVHVRGAF